MNMIMHGDGHGGVHHHNGFLNVNGIFEGRFDIILTNPPFGANVEPADVVEESHLEADSQTILKYQSEYGEPYLRARKRLQAAVGKPIASMFDLPRNTNSKIKTEILFIERCLDLLRPGGQLGIVLPEGIFNNSSSLMCVSSVRIEPTSEQLSVCPKKRSSRPMPTSKHRCSLCRSSQSKRQNAITPLTER